MKALVRGCWRFGRRLRCRRYRIHAKAQASCRAGHTDQPGLLEEKQAILDRHDAEPRCRRIAVPVDLTNDDWPEALASAGYSSAAPAVFIAEGLSWYLTEDENARLLDAIARLAAPDSRLGFDIVSQDTLENPDEAPFFEFTAASASGGSSGPMTPADSWRPTAGGPTSAPSAT